MTFEPLVRYPNRRAGFHAQVQSEAVQEAADNSF
jgi:hypothetical protein